jgi:hypothetical protein
MKYLHFCITPLEENYEEAAYFCGFGSCDMEHKGEVTLYLNALPAQELGSEHEHCLGVVDDQRNCQEHDCRHHVPALLETVGQGDHT